MPQAPLEYRRGPPVVLGGPEHQDHVGTVDAARVVGVGRSPDGHPRRHEADHEHEGKGGDRDEDGVTAHGVHRTMLATPPSSIAEGAQVMRIETPSEENPTAADDRNVPRILATAPNR